MQNKTNYLLTLLVEELAETAQRATKSMRFGMKEIQDGQPLTNEERLIYEFNDVLAIMQTLWNEGLLDRITDPEMIRLKFDKIEKYMQHSRELGLLEPEPNT